VPLEQLALPPQCGFSSTVEGNALTRDGQVAELALVVETPRRSGATPDGSQAGHDPAPCWWGG
jgi:hypothetical protein